MTSHRPQLPSPIRPDPDDPGKDGEWDSSRRTPNGSRFESPALASPRRRVTAIINDDARHNTRSFRGNHPVLVVHAAAVGSELVLWSEVPAEAQSPRRRGRTATGKTGLESLPYDAGAGRLAEALAGIVPGFEVPRDRSGAAWFAWLPTVRGTPLASGPMIAEPPADGTPAEVRPWRIAGLVPTLDVLVELLLAGMGRSVLAPGVIAGKTLAHWADVLRFAAALVARQQFLPGVDLEADPPRARWEPVIGGADAPRMAQLARAMPHAARCLGQAADQAPEASAAAVLGSVLGGLVDHLVRSSAKPGTLATQGFAKKSPRAKTPEFASVHDRWMFALGSADGVLGGERADLERLAEQVRSWHRPIAAATATPFRLCFRLEEPEAADDKPEPDPDSWYVRYLLQAASDPSLLVPAADAWQPRGRRAQVLERGGFRPREYLLAALGQAAAVSPRIEASLREPSPSGVALDATGAFEFLSQTAWLLEQDGFGVMLPAWWGRKGTKLRLAARAVVTPPKLRSKAGLGLETVLNFRWELALGGEPLSLAELKALAKLKAPLVKVRGQWVQLNADEIQAALEFWKAKGQAQVSAREAVQMALGRAQPPAGLEFEGMRASGWFAELLGQLQSGAAVEPIPPPGGFRGQLRPYQERGYAWLAFLRRWGFGACLADDMGLGKTVQTLALVQHAWEAADGDRPPTLLVCPTSVVGNWQKEAARFTPDLPVMVHHGSGRMRGPKFRDEAGRHALVLSSYALLHRDFATLKEVPWAGVILDEAQNIKNPQAKQSQSARALPGAFRVALTGTPVENHVGDLWSIMDFLNPGLLGSQAEFKRTFHVPIQANRDPEATRRLQKLTGPFLLRRVKTDKAIIADLPDKLEMKVYCTLTREQASLYEAVVEEAAEQIDAAEGIQRKGLVLATLSKLKQVCNHPRQFLGDNSPIPDRSGKLARLTEMIEEALAAGDRALIFTQFSEMGEILRLHLQESFGREALFLHGGVPKARRDRMVARFQAAGPDDPPLFLLTTKAGGTGLNLTAANHVFHFDRWWNPAVENQATDRAFRIGQAKNVQVHKFVCLGTLEEKIDAMIEAKQELAGAVVGTGEDWLTKLSTGELKDLMALRREALGDD